MNQDISNVSFFMKYKPKTIDEFVFDNEDQRNQVNKWIANSYIDGNILLYGKAGTGKTCLSEILINNLIHNQYDFKKLKSRFVEEIDDLYQWVQQEPYDSNKKIVYIEEIDRLSHTALSQLKDGLLEKFQNHITFIATTNFITKLDKALISRFNYGPPTWEFKSNNEEGIFDKIKNILLIEKVEFDEIKLKEFINNNYSIGLRNLINTIQLNIYDNNIEFDNIYNLNNSIEDEIINNTMSIFKKSLELEDIKDKKLILFQPENSMISEEYKYIVEITQFNNNIDYFKIYEVLNEKVNYLPLKILFSKYIESIPYKKMQNINYLSFISESMQVILNVY